MSKGPPFQPHQSYSPPFPPQPQVVIVQQAGPPQSQALPALVNFFCFPGLGQLIQGRLVAALVWYLASIAAAASVFLFCIGFIAYPLVVILSVIDAARYDPRQHQSESANPALIAVGVLAMLIGIPLVGFMGLTAIGILAAPSHVAHEGGGAGTVAGTSEPRADEDLPAAIDLGPGPPKVDPANEAQYTIITDEPSRNIKRRVVVRLDRRINADELQRIAEKLRPIRVFHGYRLKPPQWK